jgi:cytochrome c oxidase subunit III
MDIPFTIEARRDTGLYNAKVGIWLFLASEVMLFGALFSAYVLLRVGNTVWPHGLLNIPIGTFNTFVLITSSVTVVLCWANLKLHNFGRAKMYLAITILCAFAFLGVKTKEYNDKFIHYAVRTTDGKEITGHIEGDPRFLTLKKVLASKAETINFAADPVTDAKGHVTKEAKAEEKAHHGKHEYKPIKVSDITYLSSYVPSHSPYFAVYFLITGLHGLHVLGGALVMAYLLFFSNKMWRTQPERLTNRVEVAGLFWHFVDLVWIFLFPVLYLL